MDGMNSTKIAVSGMTAAIEHVLTCSLWKWKRASSYARAAAGPYHIHLKHPNMWILRIPVRNEQRTATGKIDRRDWQNGVIDDINYNDDDYDDDGFDYKTCGLAVRRMHINEKRSSGFSSRESSLCCWFGSKMMNGIVVTRVQSVLSVELIHLPWKIRIIVPSIKWSIKLVGNARVIRWGCLLDFY